jgi:hypothetical protein
MAPFLAEDSFPRCATLELPADFSKSGTSVWRAVRAREELYPRFAFHGQVANAEVSVVAGEGRPAGFSYRATRPVRVSVTVRT